MKKIVVALFAVLLSQNLAWAGGVERSSQSVDILFQPGRYAELALTYVYPQVDGTSTFMGSSSGNVFPSYTNYSLGYKMGVGENFDVAFILDQPVGAKVSYPAGTEYPIAGSSAEIKSNGLTGAMRYKTPQNISLIAGLRGSRAMGEVDLFSNTFNFYTMKTNWTNAYGYLFGVGYEKEDIGLRVSLTYNSQLKHSFKATERIRHPLLGTSVFETDFNTTIPQSINLNFQTGIAKDLLLFGSIRWVEWKKFDITPTIYNSVAMPGRSLVDYGRNTITWRLGLGRKLTERWSAAIALAYEESSKEPVGNLGPTSGRKSVAVAGTYNAKSGFRISNFVKFILPGDARTSLGSFKNNTAISVGTRIGYHF